MFFQIDPAKGIPIYVQIKQQIKYFIAVGLFKMDEALPSIRELAIRLRINPNTVLRAYRELEEEGVVYTIAGKGVFVSRPFRGKEGTTIIGKALDKILIDAFHYMFSPKEVKQILEDRIKEFEKEKSS